jgi:GNAT superfamily N-acetyltransferase
VITIRDYHESDAPAVGRIIADTFGGYDLDFAPPERRHLYLGPFRHARSPEKAHQEAIAAMIQTEMVFVAEENGEVVGVLRGQVDKLQSLFVRGDHHRQGIGRRLVERFEGECLRQGGDVVRLQAALYAVPFYIKMGYKRSTGIRTAKIFDGEGFPYQPMRKVLKVGTRR